MEKKFAKDLQKGHTYLVSRNVFDVSQIYVVLVTDKAYNLRWKSGSESWELKENFENTYYLIEDISDFIVVPDAKNEKLDVKINYTCNWVECFACNGTGNIPNADSTSGLKLCPVCNGGKFILNVNAVEK